MNFTHCYSIPAKGHADISFIDIKLKDGTNQFKDTKLFIDPCLIEMKNDPWTELAHQTIQSYFEIFYELYKTHASDSRKLQLFEHTHEINATKLGYGNGRNGKAKTPSGMLSTFRHVEKLIDDNINMTQAMDLNLFVEGFAEDCLSDMLTNILFKHLNDFTLAQCQQYGIPVAPLPRTYYYWDPHKNGWQAYSAEGLVHEGETILLVPKHIVRQRYYFNISQYFGRIILEKIQNEETTHDAKGKEVRPYKKDIKNRLLTDGADEKTIAIRMTAAEPNLLEQYHGIIPHLYLGQGMTDDELNEILYVS